jgi:hypothetical protein
MNRFKGRVKRLEHNYDAQLGICVACLKSH